MSKPLEVNPFSHQVKYPVVALSVVECLDSDVDSSQLDLSTIGLDRREVGRLAERWLTVNG